MGTLTSTDTSGEAAGAELAIDFDHLQRFTMGNRALESEVLSLFRSQSHTCIERLRQAEGDREWKEAAHTLKGAAAGIGAWAVHEASRVAEQMQGEARLGAASSAVAAIEAAVGETDTMIAQFLNE